MSPPAEAFESSVPMIPGLSTESVRELFLSLLSGGARLNVGWCNTFASLFEDGNNSFNLSQVLSGQPTAVIQMVMNTFRNSNGFWHVSASTPFIATRTKINTLPRPKRVVRNEVNQ